jgi:hypothetical protein
MNKMDKTAINSQLIKGLELKLGFVQKIENDSQDFINDNDHGQKESI